MAQKTSTRKKTSQSRNTKSPAKKSTSTKTRTTSQTRQNSQARQTSRPANRKKKHNPFRDEIILIVTAVVSILLILSYLHLGGRLSDYLNNIVFGLMGFFARIFPFALFLGVAFGISNRGNKVAKRKIISSIGFAVILTALLQLIAYPNIHMSELGKAYQVCARDRIGGGLIGSIISSTLVTLVGKIGAYVVLLALLAILFMFVTEIFIFSTLGKKSVEHISEMRERRKMEYEYDDEYEEYEEYDHAPKVVPRGERRKAKVFTFERDENKETTVVDKSEAVPDTKQKGKNKRKAVSLFELQSEETDSVQEKTEKADILPNITIHRADPKTASDAVPFAEEEPVYEQELRNKFEQTDSDAVQTDELMDETKDISAELEDIIIHNPNVQDEPVAELQELVVKDTEPVTEQVFDNSFEPEFEEEPFAMPGGEVIPAVFMDDTTDVVPHRQGFVMPTANEEKAEDELIRVGKYDHKKQHHSSSHKQVHAKTASSETVVEELKIEAKPIKKEHVFPPVSLLSRPKGAVKGTSDHELQETAYKLQSTLDSFGVKVTVTNVSCGPAVTRYELQPEQGVKVSRITNLADDIKLNLAAADIRIEAPIPGKAAVGIEVPNKVNSMVTFRELIESTEFQSHDSGVAFAVGKDIGGQTVVTDIAKMPHLLIAGATGSGKSVCINTLIMSILYKASPDDVKLIMVDPKVVELSVYNGIPHLLIPVVTDPKKASAALNWAVAEMTDRYKKFAELGVRDVKGYNKKIETIEDNQDERYQKMPQIVIIVDELADLMMVAPGEVEDAICRLAQMARAAGLHLIIATQRPSVNVITGLIKANVPSRIAFSVSSAIDSRTILDGAGAEKLLGKGDMLFFPSGYPKPVRIQGAFVSDKEVSSVVEFLKEQYEGEGVTTGNSELESKITAISNTDASKSKESAYDDYFADCGKFIIEKDKASIGMLQRMFKIGYNRAARIMDQLYEAGVVGPDVGTKPRTVLMSMEEFELYVEEYV
ncbi:MAG: DNA translocase FtsK [bacterium]|nr:DNA translocase FtsK [bacterium]